MDGFNASSVGSPPEISTGTLPIKGRVPNWPPAYKTPSGFVGLMRPAMVPALNVPPVLIAILRATSDFFALGLRRQSSSASLCHRS